MKVVIIDYKAGNIHSVKLALQRMGIEAIISHDAATIQSADKVIFPGVGAAKSAMDSLKKHRLDELIPTLKQPFLGICLGQQLLCEFSEEGHTDCLGVFPLTVQKLQSPHPKDLKVPHMGWNQLEDLKGVLFEGLKSPYVYFVHSYYAPFDKQYTVATCNYIENFSAALQKDNFYAVQFHPEKSSEVGERILQNFIQKL